MKINNNNGNHGNNNNTNNNKVCCIYNYTIYTKNFVFVDFNPIKSKFCKTTHDEIIYLIYHHNFKSIALIGWALLDYESVTQDTLVYIHIYIYIYNR